MEIKEQLLCKLDKESSEYIKRIANQSLFIDYPFSIGICDSNTILFRATSHYPKDDLFRKKYVRYPSDLDKIELNRCNLPRQQIFYAAKTAEGALSEKSKCIRGEFNKPETIYLSRWVLLSDIFLVDFYFRTIESVKNENLQNYLLQRYNDIKSNFSNYDQIIKDLSFIGDKFAVNGDREYPFTALACNEICRKVISGKKISGITYTGTTYNHYFKRCLNNYTNLAVIPELIEDESIILTDVIKLVIPPEIDFEIVEATEKTETIKDEIKLIDIDLLSDARVNEIKEMLQNKQS